MTLVDIVEFALQFADGRGAEPTCGTKRCVSINVLSKAFPVTPKKIDEWVFCKSEREAVGAVINELERLV